MRKFQKSIFILAAFILLILIWSFWRVPVKDASKFGVTYSGRFAEELGLNPRDTFVHILDNLGAREIRVGIYWDKAEPEEGKYVFNDIDFYLSEAAKRNAKIIIALGRKLPRWPECFRPAWVLSHPNEEVFEKEKLLEFIKIAVTRYKENSALKYWQVENEPFLNFGSNCPLFGGEFLDKEISLVKSVDQVHSVLITDSGELSLWVSAASRGDVFGTTMYRKIWSRFFGYITYPLPPGFFRVKRALAELFIKPKPMIVSELQAEPWVSGSFGSLAYEDQMKFFNFADLKNNISYAKETGFDEFYLWGVEWWYWLKLHDHPEFLDYAREIIKNPTLK